MRIIKKIKDFLISDDIEKSLILYFSTRPSGIILLKRPFPNNGPRKASPFAPTHDPIDLENIPSALETGEFFYTGCRLICQYSPSNFEDKYYKSIQNFENVLKSFDVSDNEIKLNQRFEENPSISLEYLFSLFEENDIFTGDIRTHVYSGRDGNRFENGQLLSFPLNKKILSEILKYISV